MRCSQLAGVFLLVLASVFFAFAQDPAVRGLDLAFKVGAGRYLVDDEGMSLYAHVFGTNVESNRDCRGDCAVNWLPYIASMDFVVPNSLDFAMLGEYVRDDGSVQATYNGWPLYYFAEDIAIGDIRGQGLDNAWHLVSAKGQLIGAEIPVDTPVIAGVTNTDEIGSSTADEDVALFEDYMSLGKTVFSQAAVPTCATCHGAEGEGGAAPALANNSKLTNSERVIRTILRGGHIMPAFGDQLPDDRVAAVITFVSNSWGNELGLTTAEEVRAVR